MNREPPNLYTRVMGSRLVAPATMVITGILTFLWWRTGCDGDIGYFTIPLYFAAGKAMAELNAYRAYCAEWDAMLPEATESKPRMRFTFRGSMLVILVASAGTAFATRSEPMGQLHAWALVLMVFSAMLWAAVMLMRLVWWLLIGRRRNRMPLVGVAVRRPVVTIHSLRTAYQRLPNYCQQLLAGRS